MQRTFAVVLGILAFAFFLRVLGQVLVAIGHVGFLPPMAAWQSGLLPYPVLLAFQILILAVQVKVSQDIWQDAGFFAHRRPRAGLILCWLSCVYFAAMVLRYAVTMALYPEWRWFTGTIPICFHFVLAAYLFVLSRFQVWTDRGASSEVGEPRREGP